MANHPIGRCMSSLPELGQKFRRMCVSTFGIEGARARRRRVYAPSCPAVRGLISLYPQLGSDPGTFGLNARRVLQFNIGWAVVRHCPYSVCSASIRRVTSVALAQRIWGESGQDCALVSELTCRYAY